MEKEQTARVIRKLSKLIIVTGIFILLIPVAIVFSPFYIHSSKTLGCATKDPVLICGVTVNLSDNAIKGKAIFNANCAACHRLDKNMTGPALSGVDSTTFFNYMSLISKPIDSASYAKLGVDYHQNQFFKYLDSLQKRQLFEYIIQKEEL